MNELIPTQVVFRNFPLNLALRTSVYQRVLRLQRAYGRILRCTVSAGYPHHRHHKGDRINVRISLRLPRGQVITTYALSPSLAHPNLNMALRDAFAAAHKQLRRQIERRRGHQLATRGVGLRGLDQETRRLRSVSLNSWRRAPTRGKERSQIQRLRKTKKAA